MSNVQTLSFDNVNVVEVNSLGKGKKRKQPTKTIDASDDFEQENTHNAKMNEQNKNKKFNNKTKGKRDNSDEDDNEDGFKDFTPQQLAQKWRENKAKEAQLVKDEEDALINNSRYKDRLESLEKVDTKKIKHNVHRHKLQATKDTARMAVIENIYADEFLLPTQAGGLEINDKRGILTTRHLSQADLLQDASDTVKRKAIHLQGLQYGPYQAEYTRNGKYLLLLGERGHVTSIDWRNGQVLQENNVKEQIFDGCYLQDHTIYALAQKGNVSIYDGDGIEVHAMKHESTQFPRKLQFLPYHFLLVGGSQTGMISYRDVSTGELVSWKKTKKGSVLALTQNPQNAVITAGHNQGLVTMWTPNMTDAVVTMKVHGSGAVSDVCIDESGRYMTSVGTDGYLKLWDVRKYQEVAAVRLHQAATTVDISHNNMVAVGAKSYLTVYKMDDIQKVALAAGLEKNSRPEYKPYMTEQFKANNITKTRFVPYEDLLGVGLHGSFRHCIIPGSGAANFDSWAANPFESKSQRRERVVKSLLEKLQPDMITLDNHAFNVMDANLASEEKSKQVKSWNDSFKHKIDLDKDRARDRIGKKLKRKKQSIVEEKNEQFTDYLQRKREEEKEKKLEKAKGPQLDHNGKPIVRSALDRFL